MAFVPEDGTGLPDANSLVSIGFADEYFSDRGDITWGTLALSQKQAALIAGTAYASTQYDYKGQKAFPNQALPFPRVGVADPSGGTSVGVPACVKHVVCELAVRASKGPLIQDPVVDAGGRPVKMVQKRVGPLQKTIEYAGPGEYIAMSRYPAVDALMCPWLVNKEWIYTNGVKVASARIEGIKNSRIAQVAADTNRYTGPVNENGRDVGYSNGNSSF